MYHTDKGHCCFGCDITEIFQRLIFDDVICKICSSGRSESIKSTFTVSRYLKKPPSVLKILFQKVTYDMTIGEVVKNELKLAMPSEYLYKQP